MEELGHGVEFSVDSAPVALGLLTPGLLPPGVGPPVCGQLAGERHHGRNQDQEFHRHSVAHERCGEPGQRLGHHHQLGRIGDGVDHGVGIVRPRRGVVVTGEIGRDDVVASRP